MQSNRSDRQCNNSTHSGSPMPPPKFGDDMPAPREMGDNKRKDTGQHRSGHRPDQQGYTNFTGLGQQPIQ